MKDISVRLINVRIPTDQDRGNGTEFVTERKASQDVFLKHAIIQSEVLH